jgi:hypothetical protein
MITLIRPILITFVTSRRVKELLCDLLDKLVKTTDNQLDDLAASSVRKALLG